MCPCLVALPLALLSGSDAAASRPAPPTLDCSPRSEFSVEGRTGAIDLAAGGVHGRVLVPGDVLAVRASLRNTGNTEMPAFNPGMLSPAGEVAVLGLFDADGRFIANLFRPGPGGSVRSPEQGDWCAIPPKGIVVIGRRFKLEESKGVPQISWFELPPGRYSLQMILDRRLVGDSPWGPPYWDCEGDKTSREYLEFRVRTQQAGLERRKAEGPPKKTADQLYDEWAKAHPSGELARSNVVDLIIAARPAEAPKPR